MSKINNHLTNLAKAFGTLSTHEEIAAFIRDLLTDKEITELDHRLGIAKRLLEREKTYLEIAAEFGTSTTTVTRVADWLFNKPNRGYQTVISRLIVD